MDSAYVSLASLSFLCYLASIIHYIRSLFLLGREREGVGADKSAVGAIMHINEITR
jgi:hypothetical protein